MSFCHKTLTGYFGNLVFQFDKAYIMMVQRDIMMTDRVCVPTLPVSGHRACPCAAGAPSHTAVRLSPPLSPPSWCCCHLPASLSTTHTQQHSVSTVPRWGKTSVKVQMYMNIYNILIIIYWAGIIENCLRYNLLYINFIFSDISFHKLWFIFYIYVPQDLIVFS